MFPDWLDAAAACRSRSSSLGRAELGKREGNSVRPFAADEGIERSGSCVLVVSFGRVTRLARRRTEEAVLALGGI